MGKDPLHFPKQMEMLYSFGYISTLCDIDTFLIGDINNQVVNELSLGQIVREKPSSNFDRKIIFG
jgi:hypothetical protein